MRAGAEEPVSSRGFSRALTGRLEACLLPASLVRTRPGSGVWNTMTKS